MATRKRRSEDEGYEKALEEIAELADRLIGKKYDQALVDILRMLDEVAGGHGVDFEANAVDVIEEEPH